MPGLRAWGLSVVAAIVLLFPIRQATAQQTPIPPPITEASLPHREPVNPERTGNPIIGVMVIIGAIGFLVLVAWLFSRIGDNGSRSTDGTLN